MELQDKIIELGTIYGTKIILALLVWVIGSIAIKHVVKIVSAIFEKTDFDEALERFLESLINVVLKVLLVR